MFDSPSILNQSVRGVAWLIVGIVVSASPKPAQAADHSKPNIIFIMVDDMGYADLGCYGGREIATPNIDRMASEGMRFTQAYSGCTVCAPARSTLMTGMHMGHTSVRSNTGGVALRDDDVTIAEVLRSAGYATGGFGKWGLGDIGTEGTPEKQGFDLFYGYYHQIHAHSYWPRFLVRNGEKEYLPGNDRNSGTIHAHELIFRETLRFIEQHQDEPFFCYAAWTPPHGSYQIPPDLPEIELYRDKPWPRRDKVIAAMNTWLDRQVGLLLDQLRRLGIADNTIVFFCSDNGAAYRLEGTLDSSGPLRGAKRSMYEGGIRVPMIAYWPGKIRAGGVSNLQWYFPDVMPTLVELATGDEQAGFLPAGINGMSIVPTLLGEKASGRKQATRPYLYWEWQLYDWGQRRFQPDGLMQALRVDDWKLVRHRTTEPWELYHLAEDIGESDNLATRHPDRVAQMAEMVAAARTQPRDQVEPEKPAGRNFR